MVKEGLTKDEVNQLIKSIKFLSELQFNGMMFYSYTNGKSHINFKNGSEILKIDIKDIPVISDKGNKDIIELSTSDNGNISIEEVRSDMQNGGAGLRSTTSESSSTSLTYSSTSSSTSSFLNKKKMNGGTVYSDTSSFNYKKSEGFSETSPNMPMTGGAIYSDTSSFNPRKNAKNSEVYSATSPNMPMTGGAIYSDTSSFNPRKNAKNSEVYSVTSSNVPMNGGGAYSDTSSVNSKINNDVYSATSPNIMGGGGTFSATSPFDPNMDKNLVNEATSDIYSATSTLNAKNNYQQGGFESDTIGSISDLKDKRKTNNNLGLDIFKKSTQTGGSASNPNQIRNKMKDLGIGSTSTSSVCE